SEMYTGRINHPLDMVKLGDKVQVRTLGMDKGKLSLSMKGVAGNPEPHPDAHREEQQNYHQQNRDDRNRGRNSGRNDYHRHHR
ncbi:MAG TPA: polyribonucleotide nucleotidyltransferase, partial [Candidatus Cloacimonas acidaminovorans]|nr:polyribonucleotide nucleotidyltransferase [Candidatus Cloacimonas acidaminovorans]